MKVMLALWWEGFGSVTFQLLIFRSAQCLLSSLLTSELMVHVWFIKRAEIWILGNDVLQWCCRIFIINLTAWVISVGCRKTYYICYWFSKAKRSPFCFCTFNWNVWSSTLSHNCAYFFYGMVRKILSRFKESEEDKGSRKPNWKYIRYLLHLWREQLHVLLNVRLEE